MKTKDLDSEHQEGDQRNKMKKGDRGKKKEKNFSMATLSEKVQKDGVSTTFWGSPFQLITECKERMVHLYTVMFCTLNTGY